MLIYLEIQKVFFTFSERLHWVTEASWTVARPDKCLDFISVLDPTSTFRWAAVHWATKTLLREVCGGEGTHWIHFHMKVFAVKRAAARPRQVHVLFFQRDDQNQSQDKQSALWELSRAVPGILGRGNYLPGCFALYLCTASRKYSLSLGVCGKRKKGWCHPLPDGSVRKEKNRKRAPGFLHNSHILSVSHIFLRCPHCQRERVKTHTCSLLLILHTDLRLLDTISEDVEENKKHAKHPVIINLWRGKHLSLSACQTSVLSHIKSHYLSRTISKTVLQTQFMTKMIFNPKEQDIQISMSGTCQHYQHGSNPSAQAVKIMFFSQLTKTKMATTKIQTEGFKTAKHKLINDVTDEVYVHYLYSLCHCEVHSCGFEINISTISLMDGSPEHLVQTLTISAGWTVITLVPS